MNRFSRHIRADLSSPRCRTTTLLLVAFVLFGLPPEAGATQNTEGTVLLVLDVSGSMWGRLDGREKIVIAREVLGEVLRDLPPYVGVGLEAYGHRRKGDCEDIELLAAVGSQSTEELEATIHRLVPKGQTPITGALQRAAEELAGLPGSTHIVLVSDGKETCEGDPCQLVRSLREGGTGITFYSVGFDVTEEEGRQLQCIGDAGGGGYYSASSTEELSSALARVRRQVVEEVATASAVDSVFEDDAEGWTVVGDGSLDRSVDPELEDGALKAIDAATGGVWYWQAPSTFLGDHSTAYGRLLRYRLRTTPNTKVFDSPDVILEGAGRVLVFDTVEIPGEDWTEYRIPLRADAGWSHRDSQEAASEEDLRTVLTALERLHIRGEFQTGNDIGWLDDVILGAISGQ